MNYGLIFFSLCVTISLCWATYWIVNEWFKMNPIPTAKFSPPRTYRRIDSFHSESNAQVSASMWWPGDVV